MGLPGVGGRQLCSSRSLPTGTGKTVVAFHIVFWFHKSNEEQTGACDTPREKQLGGPCILYCGPSNKSVDVLAGAWGWLWGLRPGVLARGPSLTPRVHQGCS